MAPGIEAGPMVIAAVVARFAPRRPGCLPANDTLVSERIFGVGDGAGKISARTGGGAD